MPVGLVVSVDTVVRWLEAALRAGAMANDISGMQYDPRSMSIASAANCPVILMHTPGHGSNPYQNDGYKEVVFDVFDALKKLRDQVIEVSKDLKSFSIRSGFWKESSIIGYC